MWRTGIWPHALVPLPRDEDYEQAIAAVDGMGRDPTARLARLLWPLGGGEGSAERIEACVEALRPSRAERAMVLLLTGEATRALQDARTPVELRRAASRVGREHLAAALDVLGADAAKRAALHDAIEEAALTVGELAIKGRDLIAEGVVSKGRAVGERLAALLDDVLVDPGLNTREGLLARARQLG